MVVKLLALVLFVDVATALSRYPDGDDAPILDPAVIDEVNRQSKWRAVINKDFLNMTLGEARQFTGELEDYETHSLTPAPQLQPADLPTHFDARQKWPHAIHPIRNQRRCASCWAFASTGVLSDRFAIASNGHYDVVLSPQQLISCDLAEKGCNGGYPHRVWKYLVQTGAVTDQCYKYTSGAHHVTGTCLLSNSTDTCPSDQDKCHFYHARTMYDVPLEELKIMQEIFSNGPVYASFKVFQDFYHYKSGVYQHITGKYIGGHSAKLLGWGVLNEVKYWLAANSWGSKWGEDGYFMIRRGVNECGIEHRIIAGLPRVD